MCVGGCLLACPAQNSPVSDLQSAFLGGCCMPPGCRGFADSKTLNEERRDRLFDVIQGEAHMGAEADVLSAAFICGKRGQHDQAVAEWLGATRAGHTAACRPSNC